MLTDLKTTILMGSVLTLYFYFKPGIVNEFVMLFFSIWVFCFILDARITVSNVHLLNHEKNLIFPFLYCRFGKIAVIVQFLIESMFVMLIGFIFEWEINIISISVVSLVFGITHLEAYFSNRKILRRVNRV